MTNPPKLSVIVLVYNVEPYMTRCLESILSQGFGDFEVILVAEHGSTDSSVEICREYSRRDGRIVLCMENGAGFPAARNRGLDAAGGEYATYIDADDYILPDMFETMYTRAKNQDLDILCCGGKKYIRGQRAFAFTDRPDPESMDDYVRFPDELYEVNDSNQRDYMYRLAVNGRTITAWGKLYRLGFLREHSLRFHPEAYSDDFVFNFACFTSAKRVGTMSEQYYVYCDRPGSRLYTSDTADIERSAEIIWSRFQGYSGRAADDVRAMAAVRIISSTLFNLKLKPLPIDNICKTVWNLVQKLGLTAHLQRAGDGMAFRHYVVSTGMGDRAAENYLLFIRSMIDYDSMLAWQECYGKTEKKAGE